MFSIILYRPNKIIIFIGDKSIIKLDRVFLSFYEIQASSPENKILLLK